MTYRLHISGSGTDGLSNKDISVFIQSHFSEELIHCLKVSEIITSNVVVDVGEYTDPQLSIYSKKQFQKKLGAVPRDQQLKLLDTIAAGINDGETITIFNQDFVYELYSVLLGRTIEESGIEYLKGVPLSDVPRLYKLGVVPHEIGHSIYSKKMKRNRVLKNIWKQLIDSSGPITMYVQEYVSGSTIYYEESFTEALRIYTTNPIYLQTNYPDLSTFISKYFPDIVTGNVS